MMVGGHDEAVPTLRVLTSDGVIKALIIGSAGSGRKRGEV